MKKAALTEGTFYGRAGPRGQCLSLRGTPANDYAQGGARMNAFGKCAVQGDRLITKVDSLSGGLIKQNPEHGEHLSPHSESSHIHVLLVDYVTLFQSANDGFVAFFEVAKTTVLRHLRRFDTPVAITVDPDNDQINREPEYRPKGYRRARDKEV